MPKTTQGFYPAGSIAYAVRLKGALKGATVERVRAVEMSSPDLGARVEALLAADLPVAEAVCAGLSAAQAFVRTIELPFTDRVKVAQAAPLEAEESLPLALEDLVTDAHVLERSGRGCKALLVAATKSQVSELLELAAAAGQRVHGVDIAPLALAAVVQRTQRATVQTTIVIDIAAELAQAVFIGPDGPVSFHAFSATGNEPQLLPEVATYVRALVGAGQTPAKLYLSGALAREQELDNWAEILGVPVELLPWPKDLSLADPAPDLEWPAWAIPLGLALREGYSRKASQINLLKGPFAPVDREAPWQRIAIRAGAYLGVLLLLWGAGVWAQSAHKEAQYQALRDAVRGEFRGALPEVTNIVSEVDQMRAVVADLEERARSLGSLVDREVSPLSILRELSSRIPKDLEVEFRDLVVEEGRLRIEGMTTSFDAIDRIKVDLAQYDRFSSVAVSDAKAGVERDKVIFKLTISLGQRG